MDLRQRALDYHEGGKIEINVKNLAKLQMT